MGQLLGPGEGLGGRNETNPPSFRLEIKRALGRREAQPSTGQNAESPVVGGAAATHK